MSGLRLNTGLLTREERLVFLTVSLCLLGGGLFHLALSLFELPDALDPTAAQESPAVGEGGAASGRGPLKPAGEGRGGAGVVESVQGQGERPAGGSGEAEEDAPAAAAPGLAAKLELNGATQAELEALPGIGPALAGRILEHRARKGGFETVDDLLDVSGIGEKTLSRFRAYVYVSRPRK